MVASFYLFSLPPCWPPYTALSLPVDPSDVADLIPSLSSSSEQLYACLRVPGMGWLSACGLVQHMHRRLCMTPHSPANSPPSLSELRNDRPLPSFISSDVWYVCIDNFHVDELSSFYSRLVECELSPFVKAWRASSTEVGALFSPDKALSHVSQGLIWGVVGRRLVGCSLFGCRGPSRPCVIHILRARGAFR